MDWEEYRRGASRFAEGLEFEFVQTNKGEEEVWPRQARPWGPKQRKLMHYDVFAVVDGARVKIGGVEQHLATHERKSRGRTYVNSRWQSPRWYWRSGDDWQVSHRMWKETRGQAAIEAAHGYYRQMHPEEET